MTTKRYITESDHQNFLSSGFRRQKTEQSVDLTAEKTKQSVDLTAEKTEQSVDLTTT